MARTKTQVDEAEVDVPDLSDGMGNDPVGRHMADKHGADLDAIDPKTNQPLRDFLPHTEREDDAAAVSVANRAMRVSSAQGMADFASGLVETRARERMMAEQADKDLETIKAANPLPEREVAMLDPAEYRARMQARVMAEAAAKGTNTITPGGRFKVNGKWVNAFGEPLKDQDD